MAAKEVNPDQLINELADVLKKEGMVVPPQWSAFVKTGAQAERTPDNPDWWYVRSASLLRQIYMRGPIGVGKLRNWYGGRKNKGVRPERHYRAGGKIIRVCLQQLEAAGLIAKEGPGRKITPKGQALIDKSAAKLKPRVDKSTKKGPVKKAPAKKEAKPKSTKEAKPKSTKEAKPKPEPKDSKESKPKPEPAKEPNKPEPKPEKEEAKAKNKESKQEKPKAEPKPTKEAKPKPAKEPKKPEDKKDSKQAEPKNPEDNSAAEPTTKETAEESK